MATQAGWTGDRSFSIGAIISSSFGALANNPLATFGIAFLFSSLPQLLFSAFIGTSLIMADRSSTVATVVVSIASYVVFLLLSMLTQGALVRATVAHAEGERASLAQCLGTGLSSAVPLIGLVLLMIIGLMVGFALFVVPGIILYLMWSVAVPALVAEEQGVFAAFSRSRALTKGARWKIFGLQLLLLVLLILFTMILGIAGLAGGLTSVATATSPAPVVLVLSAVSNTLLVAFWSVAQANLYLSLRAWKDGPQAGKLAEIFA
jgi:uncharacterized membrane protein